MGCAGCVQGRALQTELVKGMESHLGVKQVSDNWRGVEQPDPAKPQLASSKTVFEMVDVESVRPASLSGALVSARTLARSERDAD